MNCGYHINQDDGLVTITGNKNVEIAEAFDLGEALLQDPSFDEQLPHLVDLRGLRLTPNPHSAAAFRTFVLETYRPQVKSSIAIVVDDSLDRLSLAGLYHMSCSMDKTEVFDQYDQALKWLMRREFA